MSSDSLNFQLFPKCHGVFENFQFIWLGVQIPMISDVFYSESLSSISLFFSPLFVGLFVDFFFPHTSVVCLLPGYHLACSLAFSFSCGSEIRIQCLDQIWSEFVDKLAVYVLVCLPLKGHMMPGGLSYWNVSIHCQIMPRSINSSPGFSG